LVMTRPKRSPEFDHYVRTLRCPNNDRGSLRYIEGTQLVITDLELRDQKLLKYPVRKLEQRMRAIRTLDWLNRLNDEFSGAMTIERFRSDSAFECLVCGGRWSVFYQDEPRVTHVGGGKYKGVVETDLGTEPLYRTTKDAAAQARVTKSLKKTVSTSVQFDWEQRHLRDVTSKANAHVGLPGVGGVSMGLNGELQRRIEEEVTKRISQSVHTELEVADQIELTIPAHVDQVVEIQWKQVWQVWVCSVSLRGPGDDVREIEIPYMIPERLIYTTISRRS
jgi:hypothetical protein